MSGLVVSLKADEKFLVNGALLINGSKRSQIRVGGDEVNVLRLSDALHPDEVTTPVRRVYYAAQIFLSGDASASDIVTDIEDGLSALAHVFESTPLLPQIKKAQKAVRAGRFYSLLCALKPLLSLEADMLEISAPSICEGDAHRASQAIAARPDVEHVRPKTFKLRTDMMGETANSSRKTFAEEKPVSGQRETLTLLENTA